ncbi:MAG: Rieske 2Fe-2S domain-containing protein [Acidimicrobiales bacterium]
MDTSTTTAPAINARTTTASVGALDDIDENSMRMAKVGEHRVAVIRTASGVHAIDNACPHQGYGLVTGALEGDLVTCQWHNWKYDVTTGHCVMGEEDVACHAVDVRDGEVFVTVVEPSAEEQQATLWPSLRRGLANNYMGQVSRDTVRLLHNGATADEIMWEGFRFGIPRDEYGPGHSMAMAVDCLHLANARTGDDQVLPLVQGLSGLAETALGNEEIDIAVVEPTLPLQQAVEAEQIEASMAAARALSAGGDISAARRAFIEVASAHHLDYGHGMIYTQKAFEILERTSFSNAIDLLPELAAGLAWGTREDLLPYMRKAMDQFGKIDLDALAASPAIRKPTTAEVDALLEADEPPIAIAAAAVQDGLGIVGLLDALSLGSARRLLRYDTSLEHDEAEPTGWLAITHALTTARASRWAWEHHAGPETARQALFATWLLHDSGRAERRHGALPEPEFTNIPAADGAQLDGALVDRDGPTAMSLVRTMGPEAAAPHLIGAALDDRSGAFIVLAHLIKLTQAAIEETESTGSDLPLLAATRFLAAPRLERFVARNVADSIDFVRTGKPPKR